MSRRILLVDDEQRLLDGVGRILRKRYEIRTANSGAEGLSVIEESLAEGDPFAVVVSDMMMPGMSGAEFLAQAHPLVPDTVLMILSGQADLTSTIAAVNNSSLFRFLTKPIEPDDLAVALDAALRQHQLLTSERDLLHNTLTGAVGVLSDVLSMASPVTSRRTERTRTAVRDAAEILGLTDDWRLPIAAMLSHLGCIALPGPVLDKLDRGTDLKPAEQEMWDGHPEVGQRLLSRIPRLEDVARWIGEQPTNVAAAEAPGELYTDTPSAILPAVAAFFIYCDGGFTGRHVARLVEASGRYSPEVVEAVLKAVARQAPRGFVTQLRVHGLLEGMILVDDVQTTTGLVLVRQGERVTEALIARLLNFARSVGVKEPFRVLVDE